MITVTITIKELNGKRIGMSCIANSEHPTIGEKVVNDMLLTHMEGLLGAYRQGVTCDACVKQDRKDDVDESAV